MSIDLSRRAFLKTGNAKPKSTDVHLPFLKSVDSFLDKCSQCENCIKSCPEGVIQKGDAGFPTVNFELGECTFCKECTKDCPDDLFDPEINPPWDLSLSVNEKCLASNNIVCQSCRDECEYRAIHFKYDVSSVPLPLFDDSSCTKCGACVSKCPTNAIEINQISNIEIKELTA